MEWSCPACSARNPEGTRFCGHCGQARETDADGQGLSTADISETVAEVATLLEPAEGAVEERRLVTVLFADIAGFTALADRLEPEVLVEVIDPVLATMSTVITNYGGHVSKYAGDALLAFFGAPQAHEDDAVRALLAAREMNLEVERLAPSMPELGAIALHIGVNTGHVVTGFRGGEVGLDYSVLGDAVNVAQRLEAAGGAGDVYVGELTYLLSRDSFRFEEVGALTLKGKAEPVRAWRLVGQGGAETANGSGSLVGREREHALIGELVTAVAGGESRFLALVGEPGLGKSRLLEALREDALAQDMRWTQVKCRSYGTGAYGPYLEMIRTIAGIKPEDPANVAAARIAERAEDAGTAGSAPYLQHVLGIVERPAIPDGVMNSPETLRHRVHEAMVDFLTARAAISPLVLAIEDVHWMDSASADLSLVLAERAAGLPICAALTARPEGREIVEQISAAFGSRASVVDLQQLDREAIASLVRDIVGEPDEELLDLVASRTSGNPLFVQEVVRSLLDANALVERDSGWHVEERAGAESVPTTVESVLAARIDLLPRDAAELLQVASAIGAEVNPALLRGVVADAEPRDLGRLIDVLVERELLDRHEDQGEPRLVFHHALVVDVAYGRLLRRRRRDIHRRVVETAIRLYGSGDDVVDLLAHHAYRGEMGAAAVSYLDRAGRRAAQLFANDEALTHLRRALEIAEREQLPDETLAAVMLELARLEDHTGTYDVAIDLYKRAGALTNDLACDIGLAESLSTLGRHTEALKVLEAARVAHPELTPAEAAELSLEQGRMYLQLGNHPEAKAKLQASLAAAAGGDRKLEGNVLLQLALALHHSDRDPEAAVYAERACRIFEEIEDLRQLARATRVLGGFQCDAAGDDRDGLERALQTLQEARVLAQRVGNAEEQIATLINVGRTHGMLGDQEAALVATQEALAASRRVGNMNGVACAYCNLADYFGELERWHEGLEAAQLGLVAAEEIGTPVWIIGALQGIAWSEQGLGNPERSAEAAERALELALAHGFQERARDSLELAIDAYRVLGNTERTRELESHATALAEH
jgi:adenylate cyclase